MIAKVGRIWVAASTEKSRPILTGVWFDADKATLTATNSYIAARVPCQVEDGDESGLIPAEALKAANGQSVRVAKGKATLKLADGERSWSLLTGDFPKVEEILAKNPEVDQPFGLNADLLQMLSTALGCGSKRNLPIALHPISPLRGMRVTRPAISGDAAAEGIVMPVRLAFGRQPSPEPKPDFENPAVVVAAVRAAVAKLDGRRGKLKAAEAFRAAAIAATIDAAIEGQAA